MFTFLRAISCSVIVASTLACVEGVEVLPPDVGVDAGLLDVGSGLDTGIDAGFPDLGPADSGELPYEEVPLDLPNFTATSTCYALGADERAFSTDPEGHLWVATTSTLSPVRIRVLDGWGLSSAITHTTRFTQIDAIRATSSTTASILADGSAWSFRNGTRLLLDAPFTTALEASICGDLTIDAFVLTAGELYQRSGTQWYRWDGLTSILGPEAKLIDRDGACLGRNDRLLLDTGLQGVWALTPTTVVQTATVAGADEPVVRRDQVLALQDGLLVAMNEDRRPWKFVRGDIRALGSGGDFAWMVVGDRLIRYDGTNFEEASVRLNGSRVDILPFAAGGAWARTDRSACAIGPEGMVRLRGLRTGRTDLGATYRVDAMASDSTYDLSIETITSTAAPVRVENDWAVFEGDLYAGWNRITVKVLESGIHRTLDVKRSDVVPPSWETDIRPIYDTHCGGSACHVADSVGGAPDLTMYSQWVMEAVDIENRVVSRQDMPPLGVRLPSWGNEEVRTIEAWIAGGMRP